MWEYSKITIQQKVNSKLFECKLSEKNKMFTTNYRTKHLF